MPDMERILVEKKAKSKSSESYPKRGNKKKQTDERTPTFFFLYSDIAQVQGLKPLRFLHIQGRGGGGEG